MFGTLRPGKVLQVLEGGKIKASAPGLFTDADGPDVLPPIYPFPIGGANTYSCPKTGDEVWVMNFTDNPLQLHWLRKDKFTENDKDFPINEEGENVEVVVNRNFGDDEKPTWATIYFSNGSGWMIREGEDGIINIRSDGSILLKYNKDKRVIDICDDSISLGDEGGSPDNAMLYSKWKEWVEKDLRDTILKNLAQTMINNPYTAQVGTVLKGLLEVFPAPTTIDEVKSKNVTITNN